MPFPKSHRYGNKLRKIFSSQKREEFWTHAPLQIHDLVLNHASFFEDVEKLIADPGQFYNPKLQQSQFYPGFYDSNPKTLLLIDRLIANNRPMTVVETGIANGISTRAILNSFSMNSLEFSALYSFDIDRRVAVPEFLENKQFNFRLINKTNTFSSMISQITNIDFFYHDSDHSYMNQMMEYQNVWPKLTKNGILMSDDINWSNAFLDFCIKVDRKPYILCDREKFSGMIYK
jgi:predicted O-methyltransferase YrrM